MTFNPESTDAEHWADSILTWATLENIPEEIVGYVCFSNFLASVREDLSEDASWSIDLLDKYLAGCCDGHENLMNVVRWAASSRDYLEGLYAAELNSWAAFNARDFGCYQVAMDILTENFEKLDVAQELAEEIRKKSPRKPASDTSVN